MSSVTNSIIVNARSDKVFKTIIGFKRYPNIFPEVEKASVLKKTKTTAEVVFVMNIITKLNLTLKFNFKDKNNVTWKLIKGDNLKSNSGSWELKPLAKNKTKVTYSTDVEFGWLVPKQLAMTLIESRLPKMLKNFRAYCSGRACSAKM